MTSLSCVPQRVAQTSADPAALFIRLPRVSSCSCARRWCVANVGGVVFLKIETGKQLINDGQAHTLFCLSATAGAIANAPSDTACMRHCMGPDRPCSHEGPLRDLEGDELADHSPFPNLRRRGALPRLLFGLTKTFFQCRCCIDRALCRRTSVFDKSKDVGQGYIGYIALPPRCTDTTVLGTVQTWGCRCSSHMEVGIQRGYCR